MKSAAELYARLLAGYGCPRWWSEYPYTVLVQAVLVQNTAWSSVEKVTERLADRLSPEALIRLEPGELEERIRPCGCCRRKAATLRALTEWYGRYDYRAESVREAGLPRLRRELLSVKGIGAETADVILVYAFHLPSFIIDAYTRRFLKRMGFSFARDEALRRYFEEGLEGNEQLFGYMHWLLLEHGIAHCRKLPLCEGCPFEEACPSARERE